MKKAIIAGLTATSEGCFIFVRTYERSNMPTTTTGLPKIVISDGTKIIETIDLEYIKKKSQENNVLIIATALKKIINNGYVLITSNSGGDTNFIMTNYVFEKK